MLGSVTVVLLIACANTATLLLGKATARTREVAVRAALGASRKRIARQLVTESLLLALVAGFVGLLLAYCGSKILVALAPADVPRLAEVGIDRWVLGFTLGVSVITSLLFGSVPAFYASKIELSDALKQAGTRNAGSRRMAGIRGALVVAEIALAVTLVSAAGLLIKSFVALHTVELDFRPENVLVMRATVPAPPSVDIVRARQFFRDMLAQVATLPGVLSAGATMAPPGYVDSTGAYLLDQLQGNRIGVVRLAWCLAIAGVYGVMAYAVSQRANEIGLRIAVSRSADRPICLYGGRPSVRPGDVDSWLYSGHSCCQNRSGGCIKAGIDAAKLLSA